MKTDIEIAQEAVLVPITQVAEQLQIQPDDLELYGKYKAKLTEEYLQSLKQRQDGKLILVTVIASLAVAGVIKLFGTTLCLAVMYGSPYWAIFVSRIPNCIILFAAQVITIPLVYRYVAVPGKRLLKG